MHRIVLLIGSAILAASAMIGSAFGDPIFVEQGRDWSAATRADFYTRDQGSRLINLTWMQALKQRNGESFLADGLSRYGFLPNPGAAGNLPIGIHTAGPKGFQIVGITCSACHTRDVVVDNKTYRVDGGPAFIDFQAFLSDLDGAVGDVLVSDASFAPFATAVLQSATPAAEDVAGLRLKVDAWHRRFHAFVTGTLPPAGWGLGRIDAIGIIFNRISGLDVGPPPDLLIPENMKIGAAAVRFPFLWNTPLQDKTDWAGFVNNGNDIFALTRNTGQALAFATFEPKPLAGPFINYLNNNSINFDGLIRIEDLLKQIGPPKWPWKIDQALADSGKAIFERDPAQGGCTKCHGIRPGAGNLPFAPTWDTPILNVGTDTRQYDELLWKVKTGALNGAAVFPGFTPALKDEDYAVSMMVTAVGGSIAQHLLTGGFLSGFENGLGGGFGGALAPETPRPSSSGVAPAPAPQLPRLPPELKDLARAYNLPLQPAPNQPGKVVISGGILPGVTIERGAYESRVLQGIWAAAPYLHNGSVASLAELLKPAAQRKASFSLGPNYDTNEVGLAAVQPGSNTRTLTDCNDLNSGNSKCGHEWGTALSDPEKKALLEYLKTL
jgi:mono/diheme cytochrome c family protein